LMIGLNNILLIDVRRRQMTRKSLKVLKEWRKTRRKKILQTRI
jgi:hypothetical protein